jgi:hypothetical protein
MSYQPHQSEDLTLRPVALTGWSGGMLQDTNSKLSRWLATRPDSRLRAREAAAAISAQRKKVKKSPKKRLHNP